LPPLTIRRAITAQLSAAEIEQTRALLWAAFADDADGQFSEDDWQHALGGMHFLGELDGSVAAHAAVVERTLFVAGQPVRTGYVEAVAVAPQQQALGHGTQLMRAVTGYVDERYELGALGTGSQHFYERLGWQIWRGPSSVRTSAGEVATPDEDGYIMVRLTPRSPALDVTSSVTCEWRPGDVW
jgi:aminoglycoside 2'-N-acetyltransferase I